MCMGLAARFVSKSRNPFNICSFFADVLLLFCLLFKDGCLYQCLAGLLVGFDHFRSYGSRLQSKKFTRVNYLIWAATTWSIWLYKNNVLLRGIVFDSQAIINHVKSLSWEWFIYTTSSSSSVFSIAEWRGGGEIQ